MAERLKLEFLVVRIHDGIIVEAFDGTNNPAARQAAIDYARKSVPWPAKVVKVEHFKTKEETVWPPDDNEGPFL